MLREARTLAAPELDAFHLATEARTPFLRVGMHTGRNVSSDFGVVQRAAPFVHRMSRPALTILLEGRGRFDEAGRHVAIEPGTVALSDQAVGGTEAYAGNPTRWLVLDWDPAQLGASHAGPLTVGRLSRREIARLTEASRDVGGPRSAEACAGILAVLRGFGFAFAPLGADDLRHPVDPAEQRLVQVFGDRLSNLQAHPSIEDVVGDLGWNPRLVHRRLGAMARRYGLLWDHWRSALHHFRLVAALRLLAAPGATTEVVARLTGFRSAQAFCHTFERAGLPSPGTLARAARGDVLDAWAVHAAPTTRAA